MVNAIKVRENEKANNWNNYTKGATREITLRVDDYFFYEEDFFNLLVFLIHRTACMFSFKVFNFTI